MKVKLAEALLRRKELSQKVEQLHKIKDSEAIYQVRGQRVKVEQGVEDLNIDFPKLEVNQVTAEYDYYARALRLIDAAIQQANWTHEMDVDEKTMEPYKRA